MSGDEYLQAIQKWRNEMDTNLRRENSWLALAGLFWLKNGFNTFGSSGDCDLVLPKRAARLIGAFEFDGSNVTLHVEMGQTGKLNGEPIETAVLVKTDREASPSFVTFEDLQLLVIQRDDRFGVYLWDNQRSQRRDFPSRNWYPTDEKYRVSAIYTPYPVPIKVEVPNAFGELEKDFMQGYVSFKIGDKSCRLDATELDDGRLYLQFKDLTNGGKTYHSGRYHYTEPVKEDGKVFLDFNKSYNPPSAFTDYATCTFGSKQNRIKVAIEAGELFEQKR
jgi:uncharacterized protein